ncbi:hypothetical protein WN944_019057 [Citrus x changshan-huyou]|uniref:Uncharacterized protein n=1 Tax=Citrus x changshan-huyou TaxID=2935761 RepID=A0AAP0LZ65_9ROSI
MDPLPNVNKSYSLVLQDERQRAISSNQTITPEVVALAAKMNSQERKEYKDVEKRKDEKHERPKCDHCGWEQCKQILELLNSVNKLGPMAHQVGTSGMTHLSGPTLQKDDWDEK